MVSDMNQTCKHSPTPRVAIWYIIRLLTVSCFVTFIWKGGALSPEQTELLVCVVAACANIAMCTLMYKTVFKPVTAQEKEKFLNQLRYGRLSQLGDAITDVGTRWFLSMLAFLWVINTQAEDTQFLMSMTSGMFLWTAIDAVLVLRQLNAAMSKISDEMTREF